MSESLDVLQLPLQGSHLIEASAGTGKTWTIAALYVRWVVGHGCPARVPGEILVMTFTRAATRELADRIRRRLVQAAAHLRGDDPQSTADPFLESLAASFESPTERRRAAWRLSMAAQAMDDAAVHTIDAWCQRMLREHAFDSGCLFDEELQANETALRQQAIQDYWRQQVYPLRGESLTQVLSVWPHLSALRHSVRFLLDKSLPAPDAEVALGALVEALLTKKAETLESLKQGWVQRTELMRDWLSGLWQTKNHPARQIAGRQSDWSRWLEALKAWALDGDLEKPALTDKAWDRLRASTLAAELNALGLTLAVPIAFEELEALEKALDALPQIHQVLRLHAAAQIAARIRQLKAQSGSFGFADMLERLDRALDETAQGDSARALRERILAQYPVALIDEFQDTSPTQLRIFDRLYRMEDNDPQRALFLIGDPKQAIYQFRGADIRSYLAARRATQDRHHALATNYRSTHALVDTVNRLFQHAEDRPGAGAFGFRQGDLPSELPFIRVAAQGRAECLVTAQGLGLPKRELVAMTLVLDETLRNAKAGRRLFASRCAQGIVELLNDAHAGFEDTSGSPARFRRLRPADIAVLVRTRREAQAVQQQLRRRGLASVYLSESDTIFRTVEAADLLRLLKAMASPRDVRLVRAALATGLLGLTIAELQHLANDDLALDRQTETFQQLHAVWKGQGVLATVRQALHVFQLPSRWLARQGESDDGERRLTNVLHLAELLQAASVQVPGEQALVRWLAQQLSDDAEGLIAGDEAVMRLESDADLVQIVTIHKSKGLEYPVVFLPFASLVREVKADEKGAKGAVYLLPGQDGDEREWALTLDASQARQVQAEQQREELRLLYVALTRAQHALWVGLPGLKIGRSPNDTWRASAIGSLISGPGDPDPEPHRRLTDVQALVQGSPHMALQVIGGPLAEALPAVTRWRASNPPQPLTQQASYRARFERHWTVSSYSAMTRDASPQTPVTSVGTPLLSPRDEAQEESWTDGDTGSREGQGDAPPMRTESSAAWHRFPRGAAEGSFLHEQLEWLAGEGFLLASHDDLRQRLARRCERSAWKDQADDVVTWMTQVCETPLKGPGVPLSGLDAVIPEMEFWLPVERLDVRRLDELCRHHILPGRPRPSLPERALHGMLMGFADLVFCHDGRYGVLDYKSNHLGPDDACYDDWAMQEAVLSHRYDVQAAVYLVALQRLIQIRLGPACDGHQHLGGAVFLFLRGVKGPAQGACVISAPRALIDGIESMLAPPSGPMQQEAS